MQAWSIFIIDWTIQEEGANRNTINKKNGTEIQNRKFHIHCQQGILRMKWFRRKVLQEFAP